MAAVPPTKCPLTYVGKYTKEVDVLTVGTTCHSTSGESGGTLLGHVAGSTKVVPKVFLCCVVSAERNKTGLADSCKIPYRVKDTITDDIRGILYVNNSNQDGKQ